MKDTYIGAVLRYTRMSYCWSQSKLAEAVGVDIHTVSRWERGLTFPSPYALHELCAVFDTSPQALFPKIPEHAWAALLSIPDDSHPGNRLRRERLQRGLSQAGLAYELETSRLTIARWERGLTFPTPYSRARLCQFFGKTMEELFPEYMESKAPLFSSLSRPRKMSKRASPVKTVLVGENTVRAQATAPKTPAAKNYWLQCYWATVMVG